MRTHGECFQAHTEEKSETLMKRYFMFEYNIYVDVDLIDQL